MQFIDQVVSWKSCTLEQLTGENLPSSWEEFFLSNWRLLQSISEKLSKKSELILPNLHHVFRPFYDTPLTQLKVVIIGQDPYPQPGNAIGLCFAVPRGRSIPKSLGMIHTELLREGYRASSGDLSPWCRRGVMMINTSLTVAAGQSNSHAELWREFTHLFFNFLDNHWKQGIFIMWGREAQKCKTHLSKRHHFLEANHPASRTGGFLDNGHFRRCNEILKARGEGEIDWNLV